MHDQIKKRLREEISYCHLSTTQIMNLTGLSRKTVLRCTKERILPSLDTFAILCKALDLSAEYILGLKDI